MHYTYKPMRTCSTEINFDINDNIITNIVFTKGCSGNLKAIATLLNGQTADYIYEKLHGTECVGRQSSCANELAKAVMEAKEKAS